MNLILCPPFSKLFDSKLERNIEQYLAVQHIVAGSSKPAPYLVFGPPGTGNVSAYNQCIMLSGAWQYDKQNNKDPKYFDPYQYFSVQHII